MVGIPRVLLGAVVLVFVGAFVASCSNGDPVSNGGGDRLDTCVIARLSRDSVYANEVVRVIGSFAPANWRAVFVRDGDTLITMPARFLSSTELELTIPELGAATYQVHFASDSCVVRDSRSRVAVVVRPLKEIYYLSIDETNELLTVYFFENEPSPSIVRIEVDGIPMNIVEVGNWKAVVAIPLTGPGSYGDVVVVSSSARYARRRIYLWSGSITANTIEDGLVMTANLTFKVRGELNRSAVPGSRAVMTMMRGATVSYDVSGSDGWAERYEKAYFGPIEWAHHMQSNLTAHYYGVVRLFYDYPGGPTDKWSALIGAGIEIDNAVKAVLRDGSTEVMKFVAVTDQGPKLTPVDSTTLTIHGATYRFDGTNPLDRSYVGTISDLVCANP